MADDSKPLLPDPEVPELPSSQPQEEQQPQQQQPTSINGSTTTTSMQLPPDIEAPSTTTTKESPKPTVVVRPITPSKSNASTTTSTESRTSLSNTAHMLTLDELATKLDINPDRIRDAQNPAGLTNEEAKARLIKYGKNELKKKKETPLIILYLVKFLEPIDLLLLLAGTLSVIGWGAIAGSDITNLWLGIAVYVVALIDVTVTFIVEYRARKVSQAFSAMLSVRTLVMRDGNLDHIDAKDLVPGDIVHLSGGDRAPADMRVLVSGAMKVEAASITGESRPFPISLAPSKAGLPPLEARNMIFSSAVCVEGTAICVVVSTGEDTFIATVARLTTGSTKVSTLKIEIRRLVRFIVILGTVMAVVCFVAAVAQHPNKAFNYFILAFIGIFLANIPQGLGFSLTLALMVAAKRLQARKVYVKRLDVLETLGAMSCLCTDKTGTLTQNKMTVMRVFFNTKIIGASSDYSLMQMLEQQSWEKMGHEQGTQAQLEGLVAAHKRVSTRTLHERGGSFMSSPGSLGQIRIAWDPPILALNDILAPLPPATSQPEEVEAPEDQIDLSKSLIESPATSSVPKRRTNDGPEISDTQIVRGWIAHPLEPMLTVAVICNQATSTQADKALERQMSNSFSQSKSMQLRRGSVGSGKERSGYGRASFHRSGQLALQEEERFLGSASDVALIEYARKFGPPSLIRRFYPTLLEVPFNSANKWSLSICALPLELDPNQEFALVLLKGAPEIVLTKCSSLLLDGRVMEKTEAKEADIFEAYLTFGSAGERVLASGLAKIRRAELIPSVVSRVKKGQLSGLIFTGLFSLEDPLKPGVPDAIERCHISGVRVFMVTGDHAVTGEAIARKAGIIVGNTRQQVAKARGLDDETLVPFEDPDVQALVIMGSQIPSFKEADWDHILAKTEIVFARTTPQQKMTIVENCKRVGFVVAVTGDGVNDGPALGASHIGVAMGGDSASDVARDTAEMILIDDNFASIIDGVIEGRLLFDNLKKTVAYTLTHLMPEALPIILNLLFGMPLGLTGLLILTIDCGTELAPALSFSYELSEDNILLRPPRDTKYDSLVSTPMIIYAYLYAGAIEMVVCLGAYLLVYSSAGVPPGDLPFTDQVYWGASNATFTSSWNVTLTADEQVMVANKGRAALYANIVLCQVWHVWMARDRSDGILVACGKTNIVTYTGVALELCLMTMIVYIPALQDFFQTATIGFEYWAFSLIFPAMFLPLTEFFKWRSRIRLIRSQEEQEDNAEIEEKTKCGEYMDVVSLAVEKVTIH